MLETLESQHPARKYVEEIRCAGVQAASLVRQLLLLARPATADALPICLNEILDGMRSLLGHLIGENVSLQFHLEPELGAVVMSAAHARQIILNLVLNARDAAPAEGLIKVQTCNARLHVVSEKSGDANQNAPGLEAPGLEAPVPCVLLVVEDNGCGMSAETRSRLFKGHFTTKPAEHGTGLGLTTVRDIVRALGGLIKLDSAPGCGTRVTVILPQFQLTPCSAPAASSEKIANFSSENPANKKEE
jgi:two-component system, cell cycle sensor histidine kinase and response regulator CckA